MMKLMDFLRDADKLDQVVPGVAAAYRSLRDNHDQGIYTSLGRYYNHTIFGRDAGMSAKFVSDFDHDTVWKTILTLASYQGVTTNRITQEEPGRIHHEMRDYTTWQGKWFDRLGLTLAGQVWGVKNKRLLSYFAADTTATYIRLVHKYAANIDSSILERSVPQQNGTPVTLTASLEAAANWLADQVDDDGLFRIRRTNRWSLPYQTFADSVTAYTWSDRRPADTSRDHCYVEVQVYALDALADAVRLMPASPSALRWRLLAEKMQQTLFTQFWSDARQSFVPGVFSRDGTLTQLDTDMVTMGWTLNASFWRDMPEDRRHAVLTKLIARLFRDDFLTPVGIRTRSMRTPEPLGRDIDYHGSQTVWPMFNFMIIEGLRRHGFYRLARQLEYRLLNGVNALGAFPEFCIVDHEGRLYLADKHARLKRRGQMIPEQNIAFTVVPSLTLAYRHLYRRHDVAKSGWKRDLEEVVLASIPEVELLPPGTAREALAPTPLRITRTISGIRSALHIAGVMIRKV